MPDRQAFVMGLPSWGTLVVLLGATIGLLMEFQAVQTRQEEVVRSQERQNAAFRDEHRDFRALFLDLNADVRSLKAWREYGDRDVPPPALSEALPVPLPIDPHYDSLVEQRLGREYRGESQG